MDENIRTEFGLSVTEYNCLLRTLQTRFGVRFIEDIAFLSVEQLVGVTDRFEAAAVKRLFDIATAHIGVEKLHRWRMVSRDPGLKGKTNKTASRGESDPRVFIMKDTYNAGRTRNTVQMSTMGESDTRVFRATDTHNAGRIHNTQSLGHDRQDVGYLVEGRSSRKKIDIRVANRVDVHMSEVGHRIEQAHQSGHPEVGVADVDHGQGLTHREHVSERLDVVCRAVVVEKQDRELGTVQECLGDAVEAGPRDSVSGHIQVLEAGQVCEDRRETRGAIVTEEIAGHDELLDRGAARDRCLDNLEARVSHAVEAQVEVLEARTVWQDCREGLQGLSLQATVDELEGGHETHG